MAKSQRTIATALAIIVGACSIPAVFAVLSAISYHYTHTKNELFGSSVRRASAISSNVDSVVRGVEIGLMALTSSSHLAKKDVKSFHRQARSVLLNLPGANNVYLTDREGRQLMNTLKAFGEPLPFTGNRNLVQKTVESGKTQVSSVFHGAVVGLPLVAVAVPVVVEGEVRYVLAATIRPVELSSFLSKQYLPGDWIISVHDGAARFVARSQEFEKYVGHPVSEDLSRAASRQASGTLEGTTREGTAVLAAYTTSSYTGWTTAVGIPKSKLLGELNFVISAGIAASLLVVVMGVLAAMLVAAKIRVGIVSLIPAAEALNGSEPVKLPAQSFSELAALASALQRSSERLIRSEHEAQHDPLTQLANRSFMTTILPRLVELCSRNGSSLGLLYIDLDGFKQVNDTMGHQVGDEVLCTVARRLSETVRSSDVCVRLGGDEFAVILPETGRAGALYTAEKILKNLCLEISTSEGLAIVSASIGYAVLPADALNTTDLIEEADKAMYEAKRKGKNRVCGALNA